MRRGTFNGMNTSPTHLPAEQGYRMPAEWEPHAATWIAWPHQRDDWPGKFEPIPWVYVEIVRLLHTSERVRVLAREEEEAQAREMLARAGVDLTSPEPIEAGLAEFESVVSEMEQIVTSGALNRSNGVSGAADG